jgi:hypothetical protein
MIEKKNTGIPAAIKNPFVLVALGAAVLFIILGMGIGISLSVNILFLLFIFVFPTLLYLALKKIAEPVPFWLPLLLVIPVIGILILSSGLFKGPGLVENILLPFSLIFLLSTLAVIGPYPLFERKIGAKNPWQVFTLMSFVGVALFFFSTMGERLEGQPSPPLFSTFPLSGWIFDGLANVLHLQDAVYAFNSTVYSTLWACAFYLEVFFIAFLYYAVLGLISSKNTKAGEE